MRASVGRTNLILLVIGLGGVVALMLMMQSAMQARSERGGADLAREISLALGTRLLAAPRIVVDEVDPQRIGVHLDVVAGADPRRLAAEAGHMVWRIRTGDQAPREVIVEVRVVDREPLRLRIPPPWKVREPVRELPMPNSTGAAVGD